MNSFKLLLVLTIVLALLFAWPIGIIWSLNTLFDLTIPFTTKTWFAAFILMVLFTHKNNIKKD